jgi:hypothetical protein
MQTMRKISASVARPMRLAFALSLVLIPLGLSAPASAQEAVQGTEPVTAAAPVVPQQVRYSGKLATRAGDTVFSATRRKSCVSTTRSGHLPGRFASTI